MAKLFPNDTPAIEKLTRTEAGTSNLSCGPDDGCNPTSGDCGPSGLCGPGKCDPCFPSAPYHNDLEMDDNNNPSL